LMIAMPCSIEDNINTILPLIERRHKYRTYICI
jgi:hypothetical protein